MLKVGTPVVVSFYDDHVGEPLGDLVPDEEPTLVAGKVIDCKEGTTDWEKGWFAIDHEVATMHTASGYVWHKSDLVLILPLVQVKHTPSLPSVPVPRVDPKLLKEETKKIARGQWGPAVLRTGEKISYKHGVGYLYTHSYSETGLRKTLLTWAKGEKL